MNSRRRTALGGDSIVPTSEEPTRWNEWEYEELNEPEKPVKDEPTPPKSSPHTKQVWKEKVTPSPSQEVHSSRSPSLRPDDALEE
jgi:hypothetical protein